MGVNGLRLFLLVVNSMSHLHKIGWIYRTLTESLVRSTDGAKQLLSAPPAVANVWCGSRDFVVRRS